MEKTFSTPGCRDSVNTAIHSLLNSRRSLRHPLAPLQSFLKTVRSVELTSVESDYVCGALDAWKSKSLDGLEINGQRPDHDFVKNQVSARVREIKSEFNPKKIAASNLERAYHCAQQAEGVVDTQLLDQLYTVSHAKILSTQKASLLERLVANRELSEVERAFHATAKIYVESKKDASHSRISLAKEHIELGKKLGLADIVKKEIYTLSTALGACPTICEAEKKKLAAIAKNTSSYIKQRRVTDYAGCAGEMGLLVDRFSYFSIHAPNPEPQKKRNESSQPVLEMLRADSAELASQPQVKKSSPSMFDTLRSYFWKSAPKPEPQKLVEESSPSVFDVIRSYVPRFAIGLVAATAAIGASAYALTALTQPSQSSQPKAAPSVEVVSTQVSTDRVPKIYTYPPVPPITFDNYFPEFPKKNSWFLGTVAQLKKVYADYLAQGKPATVQWPPLAHPGEPANFYKNHNGRIVEFKSEKLPPLSIIYCTNGPTCQHTIRTYAQTTNAIVHLDK